MEESDKVKVNILYQFLILFQVVLHQVLVSFPVILHFIKLQGIGSFTLVK